MRGPRTWRAAALVLIAAIIVFGVIPTHEAVHAVVGLWENAADTAAHYIEYMALAMVLPLALRGWGFTRRDLVVAGLACMALGVGIELVQLGLPYRSAQLGDGLTDVAGAATGLVVISLAARAREPRSRWRHG